MSSIRRTDLLALSGLRPDGRKPHELRRLRMRLGAISSATVGGSAFVEMGLTSVLATVRGPIACQRRSDELVDRAIVDVTFKLAPFASATDRRTANPNTDRRLIEAAGWIQQALEATLLLHLYPRTRIEVVVCVLADDGGRTAAALNAAILAVLHAGLPCRDLLCAVTVGFAHGVPLVDLNRQEQVTSRQGQPPVQLLLAMQPHHNTVVLAQCEHRVSDASVLQSLTEAATEAGHLIADVMQASIRETAAILHAATMEVGGGQGLQLTHALT